ncbi:MAG: hypothetical protein COA44_05705 [Arcobacter sp.]|nr:MAG: hypothetical protein COA44_05705 [Arcobacter sp.]
MRRQIFSALFLLSFMSGCTVIGAGVIASIGGTHYISGEIKSSYDTSIYRLYKATLKTFKANKMKIISVQNTKKDADIIAEFKDETEVKVHIYYNKEGYGTLGVRIGAIGNEKRSRKLLRKIERYI